VNKEKGKSKTIKLPIIISLTLSISIIIIILFFTLDAETISYLSNTNIRYEFFIAAIAIEFVYWMLWGLRIKILSNSVETSTKIGLWKSTQIVFANLFLANITPSMAGGEPVRVYLLNKEGLSTGCATAVVLGERLIDVIFLLICFPFAFLVLRNYFDVGPLQIGISIAVAVFLIAIVIFFYVLLRPEKTKAFLKFIGRKLGRFSKNKEKTDATIKRIGTEVDNFHNSMTFFLTKGKKTFFIAGIVTVLFWAIGWLVPPLLLMGLGLGPHIIESTASQILLIIVVMMPTTPGSAGISEGGTAALYSLFISSSLLGVFVLLFRFVIYYLGLIVGAIFQYRIFKSVASFSMDVVKKHE